MPKTPITIEPIDKALATVAELIIMFPDLDDLWAYFDYLDAKRETYLNREDRLKAALDRKLDK